jgi:chromosome transmission fidelity protein 18
MIIKICNLNGLHADTDGLIALCDRTNNDIRSCINTLQFLSKRAQRITTKIVSNLNIGHKDMEKGIFTVMKEVFNLPGASLKYVKSFDPYYTVLFLHV